MNRLLLMTIALTVLIGAFGCQGTPEPSTSPVSTPSQALVSPLASPQAPVAIDSWPMGHVLYHSDRTGTYQIYEVVDGQEVDSPLTNASCGAVEPSWSPDGQQIAFAACTGEFNGMGIYVMKADGSEQHRVMADQPRLNWRPDWSPDGSQLLFLSNRDGNFEIYKVSVDGTSLVNLTNDPANDRDADWSPSGEKIVFVSDRGGGGKSGIYTMFPDGSGVTRLVSRSWDCSFPRWSPDGRQIAFASGKDGTQDVYVMDSDGNNVRKITERVGDNTMPYWVGNDRLLFSGEIGDYTWDLFIINLDGSGLTHLTDYQGSERYPIWRP